MAFVDDVSRGEKMKDRDCSCYPLLSTYLILEDRLGVLPKTKMELKERGCAHGGFGTNELHCAWVASEGLTGTRRRPVSTTTGPN